MQYLIDNKMYTKHQMNTAKALVQVCTNRAHKILMKQKSKKLAKMLYGRHYEWHIDNTVYPKHQEEEETPSSDIPHLRQPKEIRMTSKSPP